MKAHNLERRAKVGVLWYGLPKKCWPP